MPRLNSRLWMTLMVTLLIPMRHRKRHEYPRREQLHPEKVTLVTLTCAVIELIGLVNA